MILPLRYQKNGRRLHESLNIHLTQQRSTVLVPMRGRQYFVSKILTVKKIFLVCTAFFYFAIAQAQSGTPLSFSKSVLAADGAKKEVLLERARKWIDKSFGDNKEVLEVNNDETGELAGNAVLPYHSKDGTAAPLVDGTVRFRISTIIKDGSYSYRLSDFRHTSKDRNDPRDFGLIIMEDEEVQKAPDMSARETVKIHADIREQMIISCRKMINSFKKAMEGDER